MTTRLPRLRFRRSHRRPGQAMVEFALTGLIFFMTTLGVAEGGRVIYAYARMAHAIQQGGRSAALPKETTANESKVKSEVAKHAGGVTIDPVIVCVHPTNSSACGSFTARKEGDRVTVSGSHTFVPVVALIFNNQASITLTYKTDFTVEYEK